MCTRFSRQKHADELFLPFDIINEVEHDLVSYNIAPGTKILSLLFNNRQYRLRNQTWGLVPHWSRDPARQAALLNARAETVNQKPSFRDSFSDKRCLIFADGFFEWKTGPIPKNLFGSSKGKAVKMPYYFRLKSKEWFAFAGIYDIWKPNRPGWEQLRKETCAIITTEPNQLVESVHERMPVILRRDDYEKWLNPETNEAVLLSLLKPYHAEEMESYPVSVFMNSAKNDSPRCIERVEEMEADEPQSLFD